MSKEMRFIERANIDEAKWTHLVENSDVAVYNSVFYLDALSENWCALVWGDYQGFMAIPYTIRMGVKGIFTPNFIRAVSWIGEKPTSFDEVFQLCKTHFKRGNLALDSDEISDIPTLVYQVLQKNEPVHLGSQSKRSIKKFEKSNLVIEAISVEQALPLIVAQLKDKVQSLREVDFFRFEKLLMNYPKSAVYCFGVQQNGVHAAIVLIEWKGQLLHIKSGVDATGKQHGCMHALMDFSIQFAHKNGWDFSFEGSSVESVRQFNLGFGSQEQTYFLMKWDNSPFWFQLLSRMREVVISKK